LVQVSGLEDEELQRRDLIVVEEDFKLVFDLQGNAPCFLSKFFFWLGLVVVGDVHLTREGGEGEVEGFSEIVLENFG
jgi:hypothetical protein